jgi:tRNA threonylcarbamoyl adenosine modification protein YeaZ
MLLALETATNVCSVVFQDTEGKMYEKRTEKRGAHSEKLFVFIEELMKEHGFGVRQLQGVLISEGPGSYTGLRIGASAVKGLLFQQEVPLYSGNTLASFAQGVADQNPGIGTIHCSIDARRVHVYHQQFDCREEGLSAVSGIRVIPIKEFEMLIREGDAIAGTGLSRSDDESRSKARLFDEAVISARSLIRLFEAKPGSEFVRRVSAEEFEPRYYTSRQVK